MGKKKSEKLDLFISLYYFSTKGIEGYNYIVTFLFICYYGEDNGFGQGEEKSYAFRLRVTA